MSEADIPPELKPIRITPPPERSGGTDDDEERIEEQIDDADENNEEQIDVSSKAVKSSELLQKISKK